MKSLGKFLVLLVCVCTTAGAAFAGINPVTLPPATCPSNLNSCTANDVVTTVVAVDILKVCHYDGDASSPPCTTDANCLAGGVCAKDVCESATDNIVIQVTNSYLSTANERYDLGLFVSGDGGTVQEPSTAVICSGAAALAGQGDNLAYPDADNDLFLSADPNGHADTPAITDICGDLSANAGAVNWTTVMSVRCTISNNNLVIPSCRVWEQNANHKVSCTNLQQAGTGSKCDCTPLTVTPDINPCVGVICNDDDVCTMDSCDVQNGAAVCVYTPGNEGTICREANGVCDVADTCDGDNAGCSDLKVPGTTECRESAGQCDVAESCTGSDNDCPADGFEEASTTCTGTANGGDCDGPDSCDGAGNCVDGFLDASTICRADAGQCDVAEHCTGTSSDCPADAFEPASTTCTGTANGGACDGTDSCDGAGNCEEGFAPPSTICRAAEGECDVTEFCTGSESDCPADGSLPDQTECSSDGTSCTNDVCIAGQCVHVNNNTCNAQITPTNVTCSDFASGTAPDEPPGGYIVKGLAVSSVNPGVIFYYTNMTVPANGVLTFTQSNTGTCGTTWKPMAPQNLGQVNVYTGTCGNVASTSTYDAATGTITTTVTGAAPGTDIIVGIKYAPSSLKGQEVSRLCHPTQTYTFSDSDGGSDSVGFIPKN